MIPKEIFQKVRQIEITTSRLVTDVFAGQYHSIFKGQGMEFDEVREYQIGDDIRFIDWNVTARTGKPYIKKFVEERELTVMLMVDASPSCYFSSIDKLKNQLSAEIAAVLALSAIGNNDKVGLIIFTDKIEKFIPPRKGRKHVLRVIREVLYFQPEGKSTDIIGALEYLNKVTSRKSICFLISDFFLNGGSQTLQVKELFKKTLSVANKRHDLIPITLNDPKEIDLPNCGILKVKDVETGTIMFIDSTDSQTRKMYKQTNEDRLKERERLFRTIGMDPIEIFTNQSYSDILVKFFLKRKRRMRK